MSVRFESERLVMRPQTIDDAPALHVAYSDLDLMRYGSSTPHDSIEETRAYLAERIARGPWRGWTITLKQDGRIVGTVSTGNRREGVAEIGYVLTRDAWGHGYAGEAVARLLDMLFDEEGHRRVFADTDPDNIPSNTLLTRLGFKQEGLLRAEWETHIGVRDSFIWGLLRDEWRRT
ncbi:GNAT family N-acetyltransferase [Sphingomonas sp. So64.6b]|uniref:GNAT family N-acetyltransferase n=1 Tax=Sphingomonas sp. So64.6b TaxID=2997354 RepID=UPI001FCF13A5|nr:GNAT family N-acetyltransferase [Sphingomonas sp. So64.6b]